MLSLVPAKSAPAKAARGRTKRPRLPTTHERSQVEIPTDDAASAGIAVAFAETAKPEAQVAMPEAGAAVKNAKILRGLRQEVSRVTYR